MPERSQHHFTGMSALSHATGIAVAVLKRAKRKNAPGFNLNNSINYGLLEPWLKDHMPELTAPTTANDLDKMTLEDLKKKKLERDITIADLEIKKRERSYLDPEETKSFLSAMAVAQSGILKKMIKELPPKMAGRSAGEIEVILEGAVLEVFTIFKHGLDVWIKQK
jgi:hypothetical protein